MFKFSSHYTMIQPLPVINTNWSSMVYQYTPPQQLSMPQMINNLYMMCLHETEKNVESWTLQRHGIVNIEICYFWEITSLITCAWLVFNLYLTFLYKFLLGHIVWTKDVVHAHTELCTMMDYSKT